MTTTASFVYRRHTSPERTKQRVRVPTRAKSLFVSSSMTLSALSLLVLVAGCGGSSAPPPPPPNMQQMQQAANKPKGPAVPMLVPEENPKWEQIRKFFTVYAERPVSSKKDAFKSHLDAYVPAIKLSGSTTVDKSQETEDIEALAETDTSADVTPLEAFDPSKLQLILIMSGTPIPKALVVGPDGKPYELLKNTRVGKKGIVKSITQYEVLIMQPDSEQDIILSAKPEILDQTLGTGGL